MRLRWIAWLLAGGLALVAALAAAAESAQLAGRASYRERIALPPEAVFEAVLEKVGGGDAPAVEIGRVTLKDPGVPPFAFEIPYDRAAIEPGGRYAVRARVTVEGALVFMSEAAQPVLTGAPGDLEIEMRMAAAPAAEAADAEPAIGAHGLRLPATFLGELPCADCPGVRYRLNLWPDQAFFLRRAWEGKDYREDRIGRWSVDPARRVLTLDDGERLTSFEILGPTRLRPLDADGAPLAPEGGHELAAAEEVEPIGVSLQLRGMVTYLADAARFTECLTGRDYPIAMEGDYAALEHAYLAAGTEPGSPLMASFDGAILDLPAAEGEDTEPTVQVERFIGVWPGDSCERPAADAEPDQHLLEDPAPRRRRHRRRRGAARAEPGAAPGAGELRRHGRLQPDRRRLHPRGRAAELRRGGGDADGLPAAARRLGAAAGAGAGRGAHLAGGRAGAGALRRGRGAGGAVPGGVSALRGPGQASGFSPASMAARRGSRKGGSASPSPRVASGSSTVKPGPSVAISKRMPFGSRK